MARWPAAGLLSLLALPGAAGECVDVELDGPYAPGGLKKCTNGLDVRRITDPNSCPEGWKIFAPESRDDWDTLFRSHILPVQNPHFIVDVTRDSNGCGGCRSPMNWENPAQASWHTSNGAPWWLRASGFSEPNGDYTANCFLRLWGSNADDIGFNDGSCNHHSRDYLCQPISKVNCENHTDAIEGPCATQANIWGHSNCSLGVCEQGKVIYMRGKSTIEKCQELCEDGRQYVQVPDGLKEEWYYFSQNGHFHDVSSRTPDFVRQAENGIQYGGTSGFWSGNDERRDHFYIVWTGMLLIQQGGTYDFWTKSDDGSRLFIDDSQVVSNGGWHGMKERHGSRTLSAGPHTFKAEMFEGGGGAGMQVRYRGPDSNNQKVFIPGEAFGTGQGMQYQLTGLWKDVGPCMAYSFNSNETCVLYTGCEAVGTASAPKASLASVLGDLSTYKTCQLPHISNTSVVVDL